LDSGTLSAKFFIPGLNLQLNRCPRYQWIFILVKALLLIHSSFSSHSMKLYVVYPYQQSLSRCITCQDLCVQHPHAAKRLQP